MRSRRILDSLLLEMPVGAYGVVGDWSKSHSFRHEVDRKLVTSPVVAAKVKNKFGAHLEEVFDLYFVNAKNMRRWSEKGRVDPQTLYDKPPNGLGLDPAQVPVQDDHITVVYVTNSATPHEPMTPWIQAHRFAHAIRREKTYRHFTKEVERLIEDIAGDSMPEKVSYGSFGYGGRDDRSFEKNYKSRELAMRLIAQQIGTMRSARTGQMRDVGEFVHEVFAQYLMTGQIRFNPTQGKVHTCYTYGKPNYGRAHPEADDLLDTAQRDLNYYAGQVIGACVNKVFVM